MDPDNDAAATNIPPTTFPKTPEEERMTNLSHPTPVARAVGASTSGALNPSGSDTSTTPANNAALPAMGMQAGVWSALALLGAFFA